MNKEFLLAMQKALNELLYESETKSYVEEPTTGYNCTGNSCCGSQPDESVSTPIEDLISKQIAKHIKGGTFPTLQEAQAIHILDSINYKYNS